MTMKKIQAIRGMNDLLPDDSAFWQQIENQIKSLFNSYGYKEIRTPVLESTGLFQRAVGEVTDIVEKEMYTFNTKGDESITLRPELTAGCVRMGIEHGLFHNQEQRLWYYGPAFRYERPQKGRYRQFHQFGVEVFGLSNAEIDAELILLTSRLWKMLGIQDHVSLQLNTIGSLESRAEYKKALVQFLESHQEQLDEDCKRRMYTNPLRTLDSKNPEIQSLLNSAPKLMDYLDEESKAHFNELCKILDSNGIQYQVNARLVRGLDYYNRTVFEWVTESLGAQGTVCGGGRYDGLVEQLGGKPTPGIGFAIGIERLMLLIETVNPNSKREPALDIYMVSTDATTAEGLTATQQAQKVAEMIRDVTPATIFTDYASSNLKKQISKANKLNAHLVIIIAESELNHHTVTLKNLLTEEQEEIAISEIAQVCSSHLLRKQNG